ncbi:hypothetical protein D9M68_171470 [compost metagenome]
MPEAAQLPARDSILRSRPCAPCAERWGDASRHRLGSDPLRRNNSHPTDLAHHDRFL